MFTVYLVFIHLLAIMGLVYSFTHLKIYLATKKMIKELSNNDTISHVELMKDMQAFFEELERDD